LRLSVFLSVTLPLVEYYAKTNTTYLLEMVHAGDCDGVAYCRMFNQIKSVHPTPKYLSSDNDPLFLFHRWQSNLRILEIGELKSVPGTPTSHPFIERVIGTTRKECLDQLIFFGKLDLRRKLDRFQDYYNEDRVHSSLNMKTPQMMAMENSGERLLLRLKIIVGNHIAMVCMNYQ
jgi:putative transposase